MSERQDAAVDIGLTLPLRGVRLIEASAGTGKTFTLTTLVLRLLLERGAAMSRILAVTFTRAATQELRLRLRRRLRIAKRLLETPETSPQGEAAATDAVLRAAIARDGDALVRQRIEAALLQLDEATVSTIHGFCHRALREFGFRAGLLAEQTVVDDAGEVWDEVAAELWRVAANTDEAAFGIDVHGLLAALWKTPEALAGDLPALCDPLRVVHPLRDESDAAAALHALRDAAMARFDSAMARRSESSQDQLIERVWRASEAPDFAAALAERWPLMLIDEFQDTDPRQWDIFRRMYEAGDSVPEQLVSEPRASRWLCLIGDPKQAIYRFRGGDLATYLRARAYVEAAAGDEAPVEGLTRGVAALDANYRSAPAVLRAIETLFMAQALPFIDEQIAFHPVRAAGSAQDGDLRIGDDAVPGMTLHWLPRHDSKNGMRIKDDEFAMMRAAAVRAVVELLRSGRLRENGSERALRPADIAILTQTNDQAMSMRTALARAGIAAATLANASVFSSDAAGELLALLASLAEPADAGRFRAALATRLLGWDAAHIAALDDDDGLAQAQFERFAAGAERWRARGPLPALLPFIVAAAPRWLAETAGARRLTDALHLSELLQAESSLRHGLAEQLQWFARQCAMAAADEARQLRLESDAGLVQIATVHKSKGLEYPVVVLPFVAWRSEGTARGLVFDDFHDAQGRPSRAWRAKGVLEPAQADVIDPQVEREEQAEAQRQLYVALTRAKHALHVVWSRNARTEGSALHWLLHAGERTGRIKDKLDYAGMQARIEALASMSAGSIAMRAFDPAAVQDAASADVRTGPIDVPPVRMPQRRFTIDQRLHSFSSLHARGEDGDALRGAEDEAIAIPDEQAETISLGGTAFGNAVHAVLETADAPLWRRERGDAEAGDARDDADHWPPSQRTLLEHALLRHGLAATPAHLAQTARLVSRALNVVLPGGVRLCALSPARQVRELPFHFRLWPTRIDAVHALLEAHGYPRARKPTQATLDGLMHGFMDLVYRDDAGRHYVLDYKTNRLPGYDPDSLRRAVRVQDYDLQYLIYLVALRRWLRLRRGAAYDDARDLGGAVYLFLRGIDLRDIDTDAIDAGGIEAGVADAAVSRPGVHVDPVSPVLLSALDALFDGVSFDAAAAEGRS